ncbi:ATP-binding protein [Roseovarius aestuarii]|nr:ATP-binding protein [Roseovarius aestuarii]
MGEVAMACFDGVLADPVFWGVTGLSLIAACVVLWIVNFQRFHGKLFYALTFAAMIWTLMMVGSEAAANSSSCKFQWAILAWLGNALVPVAWCFFIFAYVDNASWLNRRWTYAALVVVPVAVFAFAATNHWHHLVYTEATIIPRDSGSIVYVHGPGFFAIIATLYIFVLATLTCLVRAFARAKRSSWALLSMLVAITITPLAANAAYVGFGFTVFGLDPTAFMFTLGILAFTWLLVTNKTMDMASVGRSILFDTMSEPVILVDTHKNVALKNAAAQRSKLLDQPDLIANVILTTIEGSNTKEDPEQLCVGQRVYEPRVQEIDNPLDPAGAALGWSLTFVDITDRIATSSALREALERADEANRAKDVFISTVSHELRTPLTSLRGGLVLALSGRVGDIPDNVRQLLSIAERNSSRLSRLVDNILLAQKIDINALTLERTQVDLARLLEESFDENRVFASERDVQLVTKQTAQSAQVLGDAFAIRQIVDNLISNAIKFSKKNDVIEGSIAVSEGRVRLSIKDTGQGIPEGLEAQVFGRFEQIKNSGQSATQGSGLGLHISKLLADQMSGDLFYESKVNVGTTFHIEFDLTHQQANEPEQIDAKTTLAL